MIVSTTESVPGFEIAAVLGVVDGFGSTSGTIGQAFTGKGATGLMERAREEAQAQMISRAEALGAGAIVGLRYGTSPYGSGSCELILYGTAVRLGSSSRR